MENTKLTYAQMTRIVLYRIRGGTVHQISRAVRLPYRVVLDFINQLPSPELHEVLPEAEKEV